MPPIKNWKKTGKFVWTSINGSKIKITEEKTSGGYGYKFTVMKGTRSIATSPDINNARAIAVEWMRKNPNK